MDKNPLHGKFDEMVEAVIRPSLTNMPPEGTPLRVAILFQGYDNSLVLAATKAGFDVVYTRQIGTDKESLDFRYVPVFDMLIVSLPVEAEEREEAFAYVLRFLRIRRPRSFALTGEQIHGFLAHSQDKTASLGYKIRADTGKQTLVGTI